MSLPLIFGAKQGLKQTIKQNAKKIPKRQITSQNARHELTEFVSDYSTENLNAIKEAKENAPSIGEGVQAVVEDLGQVVDPNNKNAQVEATEEVLSEAKEEVKAIAKPKVNEKFKGGDLSFLKGKLQNMPTPAGIGFILALILFILFAIQPVKTVDGKKITRLGLMFRTLLGRAYVGDNDPTKKSLFVKAVEQGREAGENVRDVAEDVSGWTQDTILDPLKDWGLNVGERADDVRDGVSDWLGGIFK